MENLPCDILFDICSWLPVKDIINLRRCTKKYEELLLSTDDIHWRKRIESTFPFNFQNILEQDLQHQLNNFACFRTIDTGNNIKFISLPSATPANDEYEDERSPLRSGPPKKQIKLPWTNDVLLLNTSGALYLFDVAKEVVLAKIYLTVTYMWLDVPNRKVAFVKHRSVRVYSLANNLFEFEYESSFENQNEVVQPKLANDRLICFAQNLLMWYSLKTKKIERIHPFANNSFISTFQSHQYIHKAVISHERKTKQYYTRIFWIDTASEETKVKPLKIRAPFANGEIVQQVTSENEYGCLLHLFYVSNDQVAMDVVDISNRTLLFRVIDQCESNHMDKIEEYNFIQACHGSEFMSYDLTDVVYVHKFEPSHYVSFNQPYWSHIFINRLIVLSQWLTPDILNMRIESEDDIFHELFYSVRKNKIIGFIEGEFSNLITMGGKILAFNEKDEFYIIRLDVDYNDPKNDEEIDKVFPAEDPDQKRQPWHWQNDEE